jgi:putative DNA-invertase from lambdoid prophage Rac
MTRAFAYCRVSTTEQTIDNQVQEIAASGFVVNGSRIITETVSGSVAAMQRKGFLALLNKLERGDVLVVTKLDRLGRSAIDVRSTVEHLAALGVRVHCLALGGSDLTNTSGKMIMGLISVFAEFERDLLIDRTQSGLARAKSQGKTLGRPKSLGEAETKAVVARLAQGEAVASLAREFGTSRQSIMRIRQTAIGIGGLQLLQPPLPHHPACGSAPGGSRA